MTYLIKRDDALAACEIGPSDEWHMHTKSGYELAANDCKRNIDAVPAIDIATIREDAIREAAVVAEVLAARWWKEYKDRLSPHCADPHYQGMSDGADDVADAILELIGEKK